LVYGGFHRARLDGEGGVWGRRCEPSLGDRWAASVAGQFDHYRVGFRAPTWKMVHGGASTVHQRAGLGWLRVNVAVPCRRA
jgi:hypothetical protein